MNARLFALHNMQTIRIMVTIHAFENILKFNPIEHLTFKIKTFIYFINLTIYNDKLLKTSKCR